MSDRKRDVLPDLDDAAARAVARYLAADTVGQHGRRYVYDGKRDYLTSAGRRRRSRAHHGVGVTNPRNRER